MKSRALGLCVAAAVFGLMALAQLARLIIRPEILIAGHHVPLWPSSIAFIILTGLAFWMWKLSRLSKKRPAEPSPI